MHTQQTLDVADEERWDTRCPFAPMVHTHLKVWGHCVRVVKGRVFDLRFLPYTITSAVEMVGKCASTFSILPFRFWNLSGDCMFRMFAFQVSLFYGINSL